MSLICKRYIAIQITFDSLLMRTFIALSQNGMSILEFYSFMKFRVSCIRVLPAIIVVYVRVYSCINKVFYFFVYVFLCNQQRQHF